MEIGFRFDGIARGGGISVSVAGEVHPMLCSTHGRRTMTWRPATNPEAPTMPFAGPDLLELVRNCINEEPWETEAEAAVLAVAKWLHKTGEIHAAAKLVAKVARSSCFLRGRTML
jgi:hypothetical protein